MKIRLEKFSQLLQRGIEKGFDEYIRFIIKDDNLQHGKVFKIKLQIAMKKANTKVLKYMKF